MSESVLTFLQENELAQIRSWRNHPNINRFMFSQDAISAEQHVNWFNACQSNPAKTLLAFYQNNTLSGFIQFTDKQSPASIFEWGFYASPEAPKGTGSRMLLQALHYAFGTLRANKVVGEVLDFNQASLALHKKLGFMQEGVLRQQHFMHEQYHDVYVFGLLAEEWEQK
jgi:UDP-4-amino-4,6-dideoxy-N-acetyl-beta-L-altrosamine N-acetyltransferase